MQYLSLTLGLTIPIAIEVAITMFLASCLTNKPMSKRLLISTVVGVLVALGVLVAAIFSTTWGWSITIIPMLAAVATGAIMGGPKKVKVQELQSKTG